MGRPKLADLSCIDCNMKFKKKSEFDEHMEYHASSSQQSIFSRKHLKNYCSACDESFDSDAAYKMHLLTEHQIDVPEMGDNESPNGLFSYEDGFVILSKKKIKRENESSKKVSAFKRKKYFDISVSDIKVEPSDKINEEFDWAENKKPAQNVLKVKIPKLKCPVCGIRCKGQKGLKIHMSAHKRSRNNSSELESSHSENEIVENNKSNAAPKAKDANSSLSMNSNTPFVCPNNGTLNFTQNTQPGYVLNVPQFQNQHINNLPNVGNNFNFGNPISNLLNTTNQSNAQILSSVPYQKIQSSDSIPKFDCDSEKYMKWLKNFVQKCKMHSYPLSPEICKKISSVTEDVTNALADPTSSLRHKSNHFYFMNMYNNLSEIMLTHLQYILCGVRKQIQ